MEPVYVYIWEFQVSERHRAEFLRHYAPGGTWTQLFALDPAFIQTQLLVDDRTPGRFLTIDRWRTAEAYFRFRERHAEAYADLDQQCAALTESEQRIGEFDEVHAG